MRRYLVAMSMLLALPAAAHDEENVRVENYSFVLSSQDVINIGNALIELPKKVADPIIAKIQAQINQQNKAAEAAAKAKRKPPAPAE